MAYLSRTIIYISQGIDSANEQAETLVAVHGLVDALYLREMAQKESSPLKHRLLGSYTRITPRVSAFPR